MVRYERSVTSRRARVHVVPEAPHRLLALIVETLLFSGENVGSAYLFTSHYEPGVDSPIGARLTG